ncbi:MAG: radical SAM protein [Halanaerobium sp.]|nr:radical SAM protein [Halanaerobium sp.]
MSDKMNMAKSYVGGKLLSQGLKFVMKDPENNISSLLTWVNRLAILPHHKEQVQIATGHLLNRQSNWYQFAVKIFNQLAENTIRTLAVNFFINATFLGVPRQKELEEKFACNIPFAILIDPTEACNLHCEGCWAGEYDQGANLSLELMDKTLQEAKDELGSYFVVVSGGEPLVRKDELLQLARQHNDMAFHVFTNGTLVDEEFAEKVVEAGNISFAISVDGFAEAHDRRRGAGTFARVMEGMDIMREKGVAFGFSTTYHRYNTEEVGSDEYLQMLIDKGCILGWFFTYVPVGINPNLEMMATPEQREYMYHQVRGFREKYPIFIADFWNDGEATMGCIAAGRRYLHINASGDIEPCAFIHYAQHNIKEHSLLEALQGPLFMSYRKRQPFNQNHLCPCPLIDNPEQLADIIDESGAGSTQMATKDHRKLAASLGDYSREWGQRSERLVIPGEKEFSRGL